MELPEIIRLFTGLGCQRLFAKVLRENDNSKNQIYLAPDLSVLNIFPTGHARKEAGKEILKARFPLSWITRDGSAAEAPGAQLVFYPQYPEVRLSGFLRGAPGAPSNLLRERERNRVLFLGVSSDRRILGHVVRGSPTSVEALPEAATAQTGVFYEFAVSAEGPQARPRLLSELLRIHSKRWIEPKRLDGGGHLRVCRGPNCGGCTLEAELGIRPNSQSTPDFMGWEIKQHSVRNFDRMSARPITLMTPEPDGGVYLDEGVEAFVRRFGYADRRGRADRLNFGGRYEVGKLNTRTEVGLELRGFDASTGKITSAGGAVLLVSEQGEVAASWSFAKLLDHWQQKHSYAAYIPSLKREAPPAYWYGNVVRLGEGTDFLRFLKAMSKGAVYYDPGIKVEAASTYPRSKRRSQFRVVSRDLEMLYETLSVVPLAPA